MRRMPVFLQALAATVPALLLVVEPVARCQARPGGNGVPAPTNPAGRSADPRVEALDGWLEGFFVWGQGEVKSEDVAGVRVPGYRLVRATKTFAADARANDQLVAVLDDSGKRALIGDAFVDQQRLRTPSPVRVDADLDGLRGQLRSYFRSGFRLSLDPASDTRGWKGIAIEPDSGYGSFRMSAYLSASDGAILMLGRFWDRGRSAAEQRRELIKLADTPVQGPADAKVTVVEYSDLECPFCKRRAADWESLTARLGGELKIKRYIKAFPLVDHPWAFRGASAGRCFFEQSLELFLRWKSQVYARQEQLTVADLDSFALDFAVANDLPEADFRACYLSPRTDKRVLQDVAEGFVIRVRSTPTYVVDGVLVSWFTDNLMEEYLRKTYLGGRGLPLPTPSAKPTP